MNTAQTIDACPALQEIVFDDVYAAFRDEFEGLYTAPVKAPAQNPLTSTVNTADDFDRMLTALLQAVSKDSTKLEVVKNVLQGM